MKRSQNLLLVLAVLLALPLAACGSPAETPSPAPFDPAPAVSNEPFTLACFIDKESAEATQKRMDYLQELLRGQSWNIKLEARVTVAGSDTQTVDYGQAIESAIAAGTLADGYFVGPDTARELAQAGLVRNLSGIVRESFSVLYGLYPRWFERDGCGVPVSSSKYLWGGGEALYLRKGLAEAAGVRPSKLTDVLALLDANGQIKLGSGGMDGAYGLLNAWAGEQGYYPLSLCGLLGDLYAGLNDPACVPVPIEDIPGFSGMLERVLPLCADGRVVDYREVQQGYDENLAGYVSGLGARMVTSFLLHRNATGMDYEAFPLAGCGRLALPDGDPDIGVVIAVPALSGHAEQVMKFVQWASASRQGYDLVAYGEDGTDYRLADGRLEYLLGGAALKPADWDEESSAVYAFQPALPFRRDAMERVTLWAAGNYEQLLEQERPAVLPAMPVILQARENPNLFADFHERFNGIIGRRMGLLNMKLRSTGAAQCLARLQGMRVETEEFARACGELLAKLLQAK